jgi:hypothetical protein
LERFGENKALAGFVLHFSQRRNAVVYEFHDLVVACACAALSSSTLTCDEREGGGWIGFGD